MTRHSTFLIFSVCCILALSGCMKLGGKPVDKRYYQIAPARTAPPAAVHSPKVLKMGRLSISELYDQREMVYRFQGGVVESDFYNTFIINPASMLSQDLKDWLTASGLFAHIVAPGSLAGENLTLEGVVNTLHGDFSGPEPAAVLEMQFFLIDESTEHNDIVFSGDYRERVPLASRQASALVDGLTRAAQDIFTKLEKELADHLAGK